MVLEALLKTLWEDNQKNMITTIIFILVWFFANILVLRFFYVSNPPQKVKTVYVGLNREEWKVVDQCVKAYGPAFSTKEKELAILRNEIANQVKTYISFEPK